jgi:hypothetical protein
MDDNERLPVMACAVSDDTIVDIDIVADPRRVAKLAAPVLARHSTTAEPAE